MCDAHNDMIEASDAGFGTRLRLERERRRITLESIAANTKISLALLQGLETGDVSRWPSGIFRRSFIRAYATAIGLDADAIVREFLERFPDPAEPPAALTAAAPAPEAPAAATTTTPTTTIRLKVREPHPSFVRGPVLAEIRRRWAAVAWDVTAVIMIGVILFIGLERFWMSVSVAMFVYYAGSIVLLGNTPGVSFFAADGPVREHTRDESGRPARSWARLFSRARI
jgi:transcriptional regulator with XRE-family HTH domain